MAVSVAGKDVWEQRLDSLNLALGRCTKRLQRLGLEVPGFFNRISLALGLKERTPQSHTLEGLLRCLQAFGNSQFHFFHDGFVTKQHFDLDGAIEYPPPYAYGVTLDQIGYDLGVIRRAVDQRILGSAKAKQALAKADMFAQNALMPWTGTTVAVTYFDKSASIRVIPYADVALVAVPYTCIDVPDDFLAIPHEVGHHVYWNGNVRQALRGSMARSPLHDYCYDWVEEIFADVYGCLVAGPVIALDFQDLMRRKSAEQFVTNDGEHPTPILRPEIYLQVVEEKWENWADPLRVHWNTYVQQVRKSPQTLVLKNKPSVPVSDVLPLVKAMVTEILKILDGVQSAWWTDYLPGASASNVGCLYTEFGKKADALVPTKLALQALVIAEPGQVGAQNAQIYTSKVPAEKLEVDSSTGTAEIWKDWLEREQLSPMLHVGGATPGSQIPVGNVDIPGSGGWIHVLVADGWTIEGPFDTWP